MRRLATVFVTICLWVPAQAAEHPVDSLVVWFHLGCNHRMQEGAFNTILNNWPIYADFLSPCEVKEQYDLPAVRDAFEFFVRSLTVENHCDTCGAAFLPSYYLGDEGDTTSSGEDERVLGMVLGLYVSWGFTRDLYAIADSLWLRGGSFDHYFHYVWNQMGTGYFQYVLDHTVNTAGYYWGIQIADRYIEVAKQTSEMNALAVAIIDSASTSQEVMKRKLAASAAPWAYSRGNHKLYDAVYRLLHDPSDEVRSIAQREVRRWQKDYHILKEFKLDE